MEKYPYSHPVEFETSNYGERELPVAGAGAKREQERTMSDWSFILSLTGLPQLHLSRPLRLHLPICYLTTRKLIAQASANLGIVSSPA
jgi:hypothetical protein